MTAAPHRRGARFAFHDRVAAEDMPMGQPAEGIPQAPNSLGGMLSSPALTCARR
jgi:hypothetical protein